MNALPQSLTCEWVELNKQQSIVVLTLNKPMALNALDYEMAKSMLYALKAWEFDSRVAAIVLCGEGDRAFCAGGDIVSMYRAMASTSAVTPDSVASFFAAEYELDYLIHCYPKPIIAYGDGFVMGGGIGLFCGASHRLVTPNTRLAMPEVSIGLYPDVGASYFLPRLPEGVGLFLGLTGARFSAEDALHIGFADYCVPSNCLSEIIERIKHLASSSPFSVDILNRALDEFKHSELGSGNISKHENLFTNLNGSRTLVQVIDCIEAYSCHDDWTRKAMSMMTSGSALSKCLVWEQVKRGIKLDLKGCFKMELAMSCKCAELGEFEEGVRALLIDKDNNPNWLYSDVNLVPSSLIESFFVAPWSNEDHPLSHI